MRTQSELQAMVREVLTDDYLSLEIWNYQFSEDVRSHMARMLCSLQRSDETEIRSVEGQGVGMIDALMNGLKGHLAEEFPSLEHIQFVDFSISGDFTSAKLSKAQSDAKGRVRLVVENSGGREFEFEDTSVSISASSVGVVVACAEHFINAERAVLRVYDWIEDAKRRSRPELAERYTHRLADLVSNASYSEAIERKKKAVGV